MRKDNKILFAIYKKSIHLGNCYGSSKKDALENYLLSSYQIQIRNITIKEILKFENLNFFSVIKAINEIHYFKSKYLKED